MLDIYLWTRGGRGISTQVPLQTRREVIDKVGFPYDMLEKGKQEEGERRGELLGVWTD